MEFKGNTHVVIPHNRMELLKGKKTHYKNSTCYVE